MTISKMTDDELVRAVAKEVMGWNCVEFEGCEWWDTGDKDDERYWPALHFVPLLDYNQTFLVVERMRELGFNFCLICRQDGVDAACFTKSPNFSGETKATNFNNRIILEAALAAIREEK